VYYDFKKLAITIISVVAQHLFVLFIRFPSCWMMLGGCGVGWWYREEVVYSLRNGTNNFCRKLFIILNLETTGQGNLLLLSVTLTKVVSRFPSHSREIQKKKNWKNVVFDIHLNFVCMIGFKI
jgi:hypothetical protein